MPTSLRPDLDNPEWTKEDFERAKGPESLPAGVLAAFSNTVARPTGTRGPGRKPRERLQTMRLDPEVLDYFKGEGPGWQAGPNAVLRAAIERGR